MWDFLYSEVWWVETLIEGVIVAAISGLFILGGAYLGYKGAVQKEHQSLSKDHLGLLADNELLTTNILCSKDQIRQDITNINENIAGVNQGIAGVNQNIMDVAKDVILLNEKAGKIERIADDVKAIDTAIQVQEERRKIAHENLDKNQAKIMQSVEYIKTIGSELEKLSHQNAELKQSIVELQATIAEKDRLLEEKVRLLSEKDQILFEKERLVTSKDNQARETELTMQRANEKLSEMNARLMAILGYKKQMELEDDEWER